MGRALRSSMNLKTVTKRSGLIVDYDRSKIRNAIAGANRDSVQQMSEKDIDAVTEQVERVVADLDSIGVEEIQDVVEQELMKFDFYEVAKKYITYRQKHTERRKAQKHLMESYRDIFFADAVDSDLKRDNANINTDASMGIMLKLGAEGAKHFVDNYVLDEEFREADKENWIHIHDKDFSLITFNCCQIDLLKLFKGGFSTGHGFLREPNSIRAYASLACIAIQSNQNDMFGGQSINCFDFAMAEGVKKSFRKALLDEAYRALRYRCGLVGRETEKEFKRLLKEKLDFEVCSYEESREANAAHYDAALNELGRALNETVSAMVSLPAGELDVEVIYQLSCEDVVEETHQAMEALIHNFNTLHSRAGAQVPFSSINYGMDTTPEGRLVTREVLNAIWAGLGNGETPIFPISVFQLKAGVNYNPDDRNYDLFMKACKVSAKRLFPNFVNLDAPYNLQYYKEGDYNSYVATMGCRTRVMSNVNGPEESGSRGNFAFTTINLPKMALEAKGDMEKFWELLDKYIQVSHDYLLARLSVIQQKHVYNYPFLMGQGVWMGSENLRPEDSIKEVLKHASYSIGFCGLAECLVALTGNHHGESAAAQELGLKIVGHIREKTDAYSKAEHMNWTCFGTPAESTAGQFQRSNRKNYGVIKGVTDRPYMTNSSHVPVYYPIKAIDKIKIEAPYHALENAGHIAYIEMDGDPTKNVKAFEAVVRAMHDNDMGYFSINHPVDRDPVCGYTGIIENECPHCHRKEVETGSFTIKRMKK
ncbi:ribonucleoside-triphosphate reductase class III catalytic subunit [Selenomonas sp. KH1T6]|nr:ribonucleoside-triphosphate reductase class III catalytic subunit [Selenomonas ruminantium]